MVTNPVIPGDPLVTKLYDGREVITECPAWRNTNTLSYQAKEHQRKVLAHLDQDGARRLEMALAEMAR